MMYDQLLDAIPGLRVDGISFPNARGFPFVDAGQDAHPKWNMLRSYQRETVDFLISSPLPGALVELSPGLGKSPITAIAADVLGYENVLIVAVKSLRRNWEREVLAWTGRQAHIRFQEGPAESGWTITNYDTLVGFYKRAHPQDRTDRETGEVIPAPLAQPDPYNRKWDLVLIDESVLVKNRKALRTKVLRSLRSKAHRIWCLSGSPTTRYADDLWSQLNLCWPQGFSSYWRFANQFCHVDEGVWGTRVVASRDDIDYAVTLRDVMISYNQKDVLDLPPILHEKVDLDMTAEQARVYDEFMREFVAELESGKVMTVPNRMARLLRLQQVVSNLANIEGGDHSAKADAVLELIEARHVSFPLLIWVNWLPGAHALYSRLTAPRFCKENDIRVGIATGSENDNEATVEVYKRGDINVLLLSLGVGKYGFTLTNTNSVIYVDRTFDGDAYYQSLHRIERFGLDHSVQVVTLRHPGTVEEFEVENNLAGKMATVSLVTEADLSKLLRSLGRDTNGG